jgi:hypothetical protein
LNPNKVPLQNSYEQVIKYPPGYLSAGSTTVTDVSSFTGLASGMPISDYYRYIPAGTTIVSFDTTADTITLSQPSTGTDEFLTDTLHVLNPLAFATTTSTTFNPSSQPLAYTQAYSVGSVTDTGSAITLSVDSQDSQKVTVSAMNQFAVG